jgi:type VI secretion system protein VasD
VRILAATAGDPGSRDRLRAQHQSQRRRGAAARFQRSDVFALTEREKVTLAEDEAASEEIIVRPGERRTIKPELAKEVRFLGVAALFRDIDRAKWRAVAPLAASGPNRLTLKIDGIEASLAPA